jgi:hypothetical protein
LARRPDASANQHAKNTRKYLGPRLLACANRLAHGYDVIDLNLLWNTVVLDLPPLIEILTPLVEKR